jgi:hypothetical protein
MASRHRSTVEGALAYLCQGRSSDGERPAPRDHVAASLIGGMVTLILRKVEEGKGERLPDLLPDLVELFLAPCVVRSEAIRLARSTL